MIIIMMIAMMIIMMTTMMMMRGVKGVEQAIHDLDGAAKDDDGDDDNDLCVVCV